MIEISRKLKNVSRILKLQPKTIIIIGSEFQIPKELQDLITVLQFNLPLESEINQELTRFWLLRGIGFLYFCAFFPLLFQFKPLLGSKGLLPLSHFLQKTQS